MADKLMQFPIIMHKIPPYVDYNLWLKRLNTQLNKPTNEMSLKSPKLLSQRIRKSYSKTLETSVINRVGDIVILAFWEKHFISVCKNLSQYPRILYPFIHHCLSFT